LDGTVTMTREVRLDGGIYGDEALERGQIIKMGLSDGCGEKFLPLLPTPTYNSLQIRSYLGNVGLN
jgi:hypothetical protein